jgi:hypothetical protein
MNIYYVSPKTLEITSTAQFGWPTLDDCRAGMTSAMAIAQPYASEGDLVEVQCFAVKSPPEAAEAPKVEKAPKPPGTTEL